MKRLLSIILVCSMLLSVLPLSYATSTKIGNTVVYGKSTYVTDHLFILHYFSKTSRVCSKMDFFATHPQLIKLCV